MPTYDYECPKCGHMFELFQKMTAKRLTICPQCNSKKLKRLIGSGAGIIFKGTGFYETDYKRKENQTKQKSEAAKKTKGEDKPEAKKVGNAQSKPKPEKESTGKDSPKNPGKDDK